MIVLFIVAVLGGVILLYYWSQTMSTTKQDLGAQQQLTAEAEGRAQYLVKENALLWERLLLVESLPVSPERHRLASEMHLLLPYLWQPDVNRFYAGELQRKGAPLVQAIDDPVINQLWARGTLESVSKIPLAIIGQITDPAYDPDKGVVRQHDQWYPDLALWPEA